MEIYDFRQLTIRKTIIEALGIVCAVLLSIANTTLPFSLDTFGIVLVAGVFGTIPGIIAVFLSFIVISLISGGVFAVSTACICQLVAVTVSYLVKKGFLKSKSRCALLILILLIIQYVGDSVGEFIDHLSEGVINISFLDPYTFLLFPGVIIPVLILYFLSHAIPDRLLMFLPNFWVYVSDSFFRQILDEQTIKNRKRSIEGKLTIVIALVATGMTIAAILLFNMLYFMPGLMKARYDREFHGFEGGAVSGNVPPPTDGTPLDMPRDIDVDTEIVIGEHKMAARDLMDRLGNEMQLDQWTTERGMARNLAFFIKFVLGLIYVEIAEIAIVMFFVRNSIVRSVEVIAYSMNRYAAGTEEERIECSKYIHHMNINTGDELEGLYHSFERMVDDFESYLERLRKENDLKRALEVEKEANVAKSAFLSNMSHELRTPINAVLGMDEMILRESEDENINRYATDIRNAGKSLLGLVNDILDFSKIEAGKMEIIPVDYELSSTINDLINLVRIRIEDKDLKFILHVDSTMPHLLHGDEIRLKQVITNILTNAVKYTEKGSITMDLNYEKVNDKEIDLYVSVKDTGIGIKDEDLSKLFAAFERIEEERNRTIEGTGLGMNITQNLLNMMGSHLEVESVYGEGSNFHFRIRQGITSDEPIGDIEETYKKTLKDGNRYRESFRAPDAEILVVDDTAMNLAVIKGLLKQTEIQIDTAESGFECLDMIRKKRYDIIFLDHRMPEMDGMETFEKMREMTEEESMCTGVPVIALTANAVSGAREEYINAGFNDYLTKPVDGEALEKLIIKYLADDKYTLVSEEDNDMRGDDTGLPGWLLKADTLDTSAGIENCGSVQAYMTALKLFYENSSLSSADIRKFYDEGDWKNYNIKVHSLKSSARLIGAGDLSLLAEKLEYASLEESFDIDFISGNTEKLLNMYGSYEAILSPLADKEPEDNADESDKPLIDADGLKDAYDSLTELIGVADFDSCEMILKSLQGYRMPDDAEKQRFNDIMEAAKRFDWDRVEALIGSGR